MPIPRPDLIVVGAGIIGAACALEFARQGLDTLIIEAGSVGSGSTGEGMGHIVVMGNSEAEFKLSSYSARLWHELVPRLPAEAGATPSGTLWLAQDEQQLELAQSRQAFYTEGGIDAQLITPRELAELEPDLNPSLTGALHISADLAIYPPAVTHWLIEEARGLGAELWEGCIVERIEDHAVVLGGAGCSRCGPPGPGTRVEANLIINAAGANAATLTPGLPITPRRGHLAVTDRYPRPFRHQLVEIGYMQSARTIGEDSIAFNLQPLRNGQLLIGSSRESVGWDTSLNRRIMRAILTRAAEFVPALASTPISRSWVGFRPATPDNLPLIGAWPEIGGLWLAVGHEGLGITTALGSARLLSDLILGTSPEVDPLPFSPTRLKTPAGT